jgi:four helix bundle protein
MTYDQWLKGVPENFKRDGLWNFETYRKALFLSHLAWFDSDKLLTEARGRGIAWQLIEAAGSISANIEEGYGRGFGKDYGRFLRTALGSARETRGWYYRGQFVFTAQMLKHRYALCDEIIAGLVTTSSQQRRIGA